jgi:hypothetical protein
MHLGALAVVLWQAMIHYDTARCCNCLWRGHLWSMSTLHFLDHLAYCVSQLLDHALVSGQSVAFCVIENECSIWIAHVVKCKISMQIRIQRTNYNKLELLWIEVDDRLTDVRCWHVDGQVTFIGKHEAIESWCHWRPSTKEQSAFEHWRPSLKLLPHLFVEQKCASNSSSFRITQNAIERPFFVHQIVEVVQGAPCTVICLRDPVRHELTHCHLWSLKLWKVADTLDDISGVLADI